MDLQRHDLAQREQEKVSGNGCSHVFIVSGGSDIELKYAEHFEQA